MSRAIKKFTDQATALGLRTRVDSNPPQSYFHAIIDVYQGPQYHHVMFTPAKVWQILENPGSYQPIHLYLYLPGVRYSFIIPKRNGGTALPYSIGAWIGRGRSIQQHIRHDHTWPLPNGTCLGKDGTEVLSEGLAPYIDTYWSYQFNMDAYPTRVDRTTLFLSQLMEGSGVGRKAYYDITKQATEDIGKISDMLITAYRYWERLRPSQIIQMLSLEISSSNSIPLPYTPS